MSLVKFNHRPNLNSLFDDFFPNIDTLNASYNKNSVPAVNVKEGDSAFTIEIAIPGMKKRI